MAQLHGRVRRVSNIRVATIGALGVGLWLLAASSAEVLCATTRAQQANPAIAAQWTDGAPTEAELAALGDQLVDANEQIRERAFHTLSRLSVTALPAIHARFASLSKARLKTAELQAALTAFRRAVGSTRADDDVDLAPGVLAVTRTERAAHVARAAEILLLLRSLEALGTPRAGVLLGDGLAIDSTAFSQEAVRIRGRMGMTLLPALIQLRSHPSLEIKRWSSRGIRLLNMSDPQIAVQRNEPTQLAAILHAYGATHDLEALPVLVSLLNDARIQVRTAAREATRELGRNAIWKLRIAYQEVTGTNADGRWDVERTLNELCLLFDRARIEQSETALAQGLSAHLAGNLELMTDSFERALRVDPQLPRRAEMGPGYASLGAARMAQDDLIAAAAAYRRALVLAPTHADANTWRAQVSYLEGERLLSRGVVDLDAYRTTLALDGEHQQAADALDRLSGAWSLRAERTRRWIALLAIALLCGFGFCVLRMRSRGQAVGADETLGAS